MTRNFNQRALSQDVKHEQYELESLLGQVRKMFHAHRTARAEGAARLMDALDELREHLGMMFALKETVGHLDEIVTAAAPLGEQAGALKAQHASLFEDLSRLIDQCDQDLSRGRWQSSCKLAEMTFENFCEQLRENEVGEAVLVQGALKQETGVGD
ncbi:MAG TPA: hypothetical protein VGN42_17810 [Pirellulales bacterium]|nr:hypothetical protein [Pirellulales bacterium]